MKTLSFKALEDKKDDVLNETIAQGILQELKDLRGLGGSHNKRWGMELMQNALDASQAQGVDVRIKVENDRLTFSHNGRAFKEEELIHLIYHGSTKVEAESTSGKLGTGFLATHLLSPRVKVTGTFRDSQRFTFTLYRDADTLNELTGKMKQTWCELEESLSVSETNSETDTIYGYPIVGDEKKKICEEGIAVLRDTIPIILAFDKRLRSVTIDEGTNKYVWSLGQELDQIATINLTCNGHPIQSHISAVAVIHRDDVMVGLPLCVKDGRYSVVDVSSLPKLYYPLPLLGTAVIPFPALISSLRFMPTKDREGAILTEKVGENYVRINRDIVEIAFGVMDDILNLISERNYADLHNVAKIPNPSVSPKWLMQDWIEPLVNSLISRLRNTKLVSTKDATISPKGSHIPIVVGTDADLNALWKLSEKVHPESCPKESDASAWQTILIQWVTHLDQSDPDPAKLEEALTIEKLAKSVGEYGSINNLQSAIGGTPVFDWLNDLVKIIVATKKDTLFEENRILPDQTGIFRSKKELSRDPGISEALKDIMILLGRDVRAELLSKEIVAEIVNFSKEEVILLDALKRIKDQAKTNYKLDNYQQANVKLLEWLIDNKSVEEIRDAYPVLTRNKEDGEDDYVQYYSSENVFLAPETTLSEDDRKYVDVFPSRAILSNIYSKIPEDQWKVLAKNRLVFRDLVSSDTLQLGNKEIRALTADELQEDKTSHKSKTEVLLKSIPFLRQKDWGVMDRMQDSRPRATRFLSFVLGNLIKKDVSWKQVVKIDCECGSQHQIRPSLWLEALINRQWVPVPGGDEEKPSSENLASLFTQPGLLNILKDDEATLFLGILGVNVSTILSASKSIEERIKIDQAFTRLLAATNMNTQQLSKIAEAYSDEKLRKKLFDAMAEKELINANQKVGELVERLIRESIGRNLPNSNYKVDRVTRGADIKITLAESETEPANDYVNGEGRELFVRISNAEKEHLVEVKSARETSVRMTIPQARQAHNTSNAFTLCVVEVGPDFLSMSEDQAKTTVMQNARFVFPIGDKLGDMIKEVDAFQRGEKALVNQPSQDMQVYLISEAQIRIKVNQNVWQNGLDFNGFIRLISGGSSSSA